MRNVFATFGTWLRALVVLAAAVSSLGVGMRLQPPVTITVVLFLSVLGYYRIASVPNNYADVTVQAR
jgi:hypothetical protein